MSRLSSLTVREMKVVTLIASGLSIEEAARKMRIDVVATALHHQNALKKLRVADATGLKRAAVRMGFISAES